MWSLAVWGIALALVLMLLLFIVFIVHLLPWLFLGFAVLVAMRASADNAAG